MAIFRPLDARPCDLSPLHGALRLATPVIGIIIKLRGGRRSHRRGAVARGPDFKAPSELEPSNLRTLRTLRTARFQATILQHIRSRGQLDPSGLDFKVARPHKTLVLFGYTVRANHYRQTTSSPFSRISSQQSSRQGLVGDLSDPSKVQTLSSSGAARISCVSFPALFSPMLSYRCSAQYNPFSAVPHHGLNRQATFRVVSLISSCTFDVVKARFIPHIFVIDLDPFVFRKIAVMVYCGKPSRGCQTCRTRKIRCDQATPACGQCLKAEKECPGYRDMLSLSFRDESDAVVEKAKARERAKARRSPIPNVVVSSSSNITVPQRRTRGVSGNRSTGSPPAYRDHSKTSPAASLQLSSHTNNIELPTPSPDGSDREVITQNLTSATPSPPLAIAPSIAERGINYFFSNFVAEPSGPSPGHFHHLHSIYNANGVDDVLRSCLIATGLAGLSNVSKSAPLMGYARREYTIALRKINAALLSSTEARKDSTLMSIMVVSVFETVAGAQRLSLKAWTEHINGAATLVKLRGRSQLKTRVGLGLFIQASSHLLISCMQREIPNPQQITDLRNAAFDQISSGGVWQFLEAVGRLANFRAAMRNGSLTDCETIINTALNIDGDLMQLFSNVPPDWLYESVYTDSSPEVVYNGRYDIYYDYFIAQIWNGMRCARIMLNETIRSRLLEGFTSMPPRFTTSEYTAQFQISIDTIIKMRDDILHSVPQKLGYVHRKPFSTPESQDFSSPLSGNDLDSINLSFTDLLSSSDLPRFSPVPEEQRSVPLVRSPSFPAIGGYYLLWPLFIAASTPLTPLTTRPFITRTLRFIGTEMGISHGSNLASFLETAHFMNQVRDYPQRGDLAQHMIGEGIGGPSALGKARAELWSRTGAENADADVVEGNEILMA
ncbi:hypothetical protein G7Y89_g1296 [Cudoniella acicularis]|uniref:Zn(2)-C6 fungal-type domain-containing protein n=1 Tax=Cudoniella acicularis TaxID=354080 RepID=A0A8H4RX89_9HELO|nr:hypothetical protein G7Y89_g1296 [Cudoniella acicularis]